MNQQLKTADELVKSFNGASLELKKQLIEAWTDLVFQTTGKNPKPYEINRLTDWLLEEDLKDVSRSKVQNTEYPILSRPQIERRYRELSMTNDLVDVLHYKRLNHFPTKKKDAKNNEY